MTRRLFSSLSVLLVTLCLFSDVGYAETCDPANEGFWRNLGCEDIWEQRQLERTSDLERLTSQYLTLRSTNRALIEQERAKALLLAKIRNDLEQSQRTLNYLQNIQLTHENAEREISRLRAEMAHVASALDSVLQIEVGCQTTAYRKARADAEYSKTVLEELVGFGLSFAWDEAWKRAALYLAPNFLRKYLAPLLEGITIANAITDFFELEQNIEGAARRRDQPAYSTECR